MAITEMFYVLTVVGFDAFVRVYRTIDLGKVNFTARKLYCLNKTDLKPVILWLPKYHADVG